jgi:hypothetical protein
MRLRAVALLRGQRGTSARGKGEGRLPLAPEMKGRGREGDEHDSDDDGQEVSVDTRNDVAQPVPGERDADRPERCPEQVEGEEPLVRHAADPRDDRCTGPDDGYEAGQRDCLPSMTEEKALSLYEIALLEKARVLTLKECPPDPQAEGVAGLVACDSGSEAGEEEPADIEVTLSSEQPSCEEERVTWQEQPDEGDRFR